ncbi:hypothetical protein [Bordetella sp. N]|uniref:hypothetical protein n=1 Tax=Bordetella sp. N TaxID=1746199 RepID=UPI00070F164C|nr:hypothetical protein [Bordetella sp. N]ALM85091.1 hypothetical protein ASB57_20835 [Bordetella sp. N]
MRDTLDCGVLMVPPHHGWMLEWIERHAQALGRLRLYPVHFDEKTLGGAGGLGLPVPTAAQALASALPGEISAEILARLAIPLRRYDVCVLPVTPATVAWTRTALACASTHLHTPLLGLTRGLKAAAVQDLLMLGLQDFALHRACADELRARLSRLAATALRPDAPAKTYLAQSPGSPAGNDAMNDAMVPYAVIRKRNDNDGQAAAPGAGARMEGAACGGASSGSHENDPDAISFLDELASQRRRKGAVSGSAPPEAFRTAKSRVVGRFERDYVRTALSRHAGNVASAARASAKHRRAFWALMRKHEIDADPYRIHGDDDEDGQPGATSPEG